jgi:hypothetical protein
MATIDITDIAKIETKIEMQVPDYDQLLSDGKTLQEMIESVAPGILDYINSKIANKYPEQSSPLADVIITATLWGTVAELQYFAYRRRQIDEVEWPNIWWARLEAWLDEIQKGGAKLPGTSEISGAIPVVRGEPKKMTMDRDTYPNIAPNLQDVIRS